MDADEKLQRQQRRDRGPVAALLGHRLALIDSDRGVVEVEFQAKGHLFNSMDIMQGGFTAAMLDHALADAAVALTDMRYQVTMLETHCNFLAAIGPGRLRCQASMVRQGRSTAFLEARLFTGGGELAATAAAVAALRRGEDDGGNRAPAAIADEQ